MPAMLTLFVLVLAAGFAVVYWRTGPRHRVSAGAGRDHGDRARQAREAARHQG